LLDKFLKKKKFKIFGRPLSEIAAQSTTGPTLGGLGGTLFFE
jgi:hypothetical protein